MMSSKVVSGISSCFQLLSQSQGQVAHVLLTRSPLVYPRRGLTVRPACVKHAASVRPEPGSNSPLKSMQSDSLARVDLAVSTCSIADQKTQCWIYRQSIKGIRTRSTPKRARARGFCALFGIDF